MNGRRLLVVGVVCSGAALLAMPVWSQDKKKGEGKPPEMPEMSAEDKAWMEAAMLNENHDLLKPFVGTWDVSATIWMTPEPTKSTGKSISTSMFEGRFVADEYHGDMGGMPFQGHGVTGYDNVKKKFVGGWIDSMGTGIFVHEGTYDAAKKEFTYLGEFPSPLGGTVKSRMTVVVNGPDKHTATFYHATKDQPEKKVMELVYTRAKGGDKPTDGAGK